MTEPPTCLISICKIFLFGGSICFSFSLFLLLQCTCTSCQFRMWFLAFFLFYFNESSNEESSPFQTKKFQIYKLITVRLMHGFQPLEHWDFTEKPHHFFFFRCSNAEIAITPFLTTTHFVDNFSVIKHIDINTSYQRCYRYCRCFIGILICKSWNVLRKVTALEIGCTILTFFLC